MTHIKFPYPVESSVDCIKDGKGEPLSEIIDNNRLASLSARALPVVKPEDFEGATMAAKVIAANEFILNAGGGFELFFGDSSTYLITQAIVLPKNTRVRMDGCTIQMTDNTVDNIFRSANIELDPDNPRGFAKNKVSMEAIHDISIIGENDPVLLMCDNATAANYGVTKTGWHGHTIMFAGVSNFEIAGFTIQKNLAWGICLSGCCFGKVHDIVYNTTRENGDGIDVEFGSHDIEIYNISGSFADDIVAVSNSGPSRLELRPFELKYPTCPFDYGYRRFGEETYNIHIHDIHGTTLAHCVIFICGDYGIHNCSVVKVSDKSGASEGAMAIVKVYGGQYDGGYTQGMIHDISVNDIEAYACSVAAIHLSEGVIRNGRINKVRVASGVDVLKDQSGVTIADYNFVISNTGVIE